MDCAIRTDDAMVSRHHSRVFWGGGGYILEDLSSANGVYFQEQRVQSHLFKHGDAVRCGSLWLRFVDVAAGGASAGPGAPPQPAATPGPQPMMQHPGMGAIAPGGATGHVATQTPAALVAALGNGPMPVPGSGLAALGIAPNTESDAEIRVLRRRVEQLQTELRVYRSNKFNQDT